VEHLEHSEHLEHKFRNGFFKSKIMDVDDGIDGTPAPSPRGGYMSVPGTIDRYTTPEAAEFRTAAAARRYRERLERERLHLQREREHATPSRDTRTAWENPRSPVRRRRRRQPALVRRTRVATPRPPPVSVRSSARVRESQPDRGYTDANSNLAATDNRNSINWHPISRIKEDPEGVHLIISDDGTHVGVYARGSFWNSNDCSDWKSVSEITDGFERVCPRSRPLMARQIGALNFGKQGVCHLMAMCIYWAMKRPDGLTDMLSMAGRDFVNKYAEGATRDTLHRYGLI